MKRKACNTDEREEKFKVYKLLVENLKKRDQVLKPEIYKKIILK
jgi:molybdopterin synthase catalytic subunit